MFAAPPPRLWTLPSVWVFLSPRCPVKSGSGVSWILWPTGLLSLSSFPLRNVQTHLLNPLSSVLPLIMDAALWRTAILSGHLHPVCVVPYPAELGIWAVPVYTWDKGERQCHPAPPRDGRGRLMWPCPRFSVTAAAASRRGDPTGAERLSLLAGLVPTQWSTLWFGWVFSDTDNACVMEARPCNCCWRLQSARTGGSGLLKEWTPLSVSLSEPLFII